MILIAQQTSGPRYAEVVARLTRAGHQVMVASSTAEAFGLIPDLQPSVIVLEEPDIDRCPHLLCGWIGQAMTPPPKMLGLVRIQDPEQRARCAECMTLLAPDADPSLVAATAMALAE